MKTKLNLVVLVLLTILFASCDSLWQVGESTDVSMSINLRDIAGGSLFLGDEDDGFDVEFDSDVAGYDRLKVAVSLYNAEDNSVIESQTEEVSPSETSSADIVVTFKSVPVSLEVYAKVQVYGVGSVSSDLTLIFSAQSNDTAIKIGKNNIVARPNVLFYVGDKLTYVLGSENYIASSTNIEILDEALEALGGRNNLAPNATVVMNGAINASSNTPISRDYGGLVLQASPSLGNHILSIDTNNISISNLVLDGQGVDFDSSLMTVNGSTVSLTSVTIKNNEGGNNGGGLTNFGTLIMNNCTVSENFAGHDGGGVYNPLGATLTMNNCIVSGNRSARGGGIYNAGTLTLSGCTITGNFAGEGDDVNGDFTDNGGNNIADHHRP